MRRVRDKLVYSPTDLVTFLGSSYATWMDRLRLDRPDFAVPDEDDPQFTVLSRYGGSHEKAVLERLRAAGRTIVEISRDGDPFSATRDAIRAGADVVYQGALTDGTFAGYSDFLVRDASGNYEIWDSKLSRSVKADHVLQLCIYADLLGAVTGRPAETIVVALGRGDDVRLRAAEFRWYYRSVRDAFLEFVGGFDPDKPPEPEPNADHGRWSSRAEAWFEQRDHLVRVAGMRRSQIAHLTAAGVATMTALATTKLAAVKGIGREVLPRLARQARLQKASVGKARPEFEILRPETKRAGLALLPPASPNDVFFDFEGFPLADDGLEYLFGVVTVETGEPLFRDWWAHDAAQEKRALEQFVDFAFARWKADPALHIYHYGAYEVSALRRLMGRYGTREDEVDALLRGEAFVDLLTIVRQGLAVGEPGYSLKNVERLYRPAREGDVKDASASIVEYDRWIESGESEDWRASPILKGIRDYNADDCTSTWQLAEWLRECQREAGIAYVSMGEVEAEEEYEVGEEAQARRDLCTSMLAEAEAITGDDERRRIHELLGHLIEFHRREAKPQWWALFDRSECTHEELVEDVECLGDLRLVGTPTPEKRSYAVTYAFDPDQETKIDVESKVCFAHDVDVSAEVLKFERDAGRITLKIGPKAWTKIEGVPPDRVSLIPFSIVNAKAIQTSITAMAQAWRGGAGFPRALDDFLRRRPPRVTGHNGGPLVRAGETTRDGAVRIVSGLDESCLVIQGPPGAGKTSTAAHVVNALLAAKKNVGITSNSHKAIENLLAACDKAAGGGLPFLKVGGGESQILEDCRGMRTHGGGEKARGAYEGGLVGGTAWLFSRPEWRDSLDYLFVDEAGQVSLANLVGVAASARNLVLLGDQMQLSQPTQGTHPGESGLSLLDYYLQGKPTIPDDLGLFLSRTWRMHPDLCALISDAVYEGRLQAEAGTEKRTVEVPTNGGGLVPKSAGIVFVPVEHDGNAQASDEEVETIRRVVVELSGRAFTDPKNPHAIALDDLLFVAPYNMQVRRLRDALGDRARVGSVDKFQGQEAPVVVLSMCASPGEFGPRGSAFLLDIHRLNVAISRAQSLAVVVGDPRLARAKAGSIEEMRRLNLLCRLVAEG